MSKKGVCDFRCWFAKGTVCRCWCEGEDHGVGHSVLADEEFSVLKEMRSDPLLYKYGFTMKQFDRFMELRSPSVLEDIKEEVKREYKV